MKIVIWIVMIIIFLGLFAVNELKTREKDKAYGMMLEHINLMKILLANDIELCKKNEYYKTKNFFKMHNKGTELSQDIGKIEFQSIDKINDYYL